MQQKSVMGIRIWQLIGAHTRAAYVHFHFHCDCVRYASGLKFLVLNRLQIIIIFAMRRTWINVNVIDC